jgi:enoyl-CoA hydratase
VINAEMYAPPEAVAAGFLDRVVAPADVAQAAQGAAAGLAKLDASVHGASKAARARACA